MPRSGDRLAPSSADGGEPTLAVDDDEQSDRLDERFYLVFTVPAGLASEGLLLRLSSLGHLEGKPLLMTGLAPDGSFSLGLLLANRTGPLSLVEYEAYVDLLVRMVPGLSKVDVEERLLAFPEAYRKARDLVASLESLDGQLAIHLSGPAPSSLRLSELADELALMPRGEGRYSRMDETGEVAFSLLRGEHGVALTLLMDFPRCRSPIEAFDGLLAVGRALREALAAPLVDDRHQPLTDEALEMVRQQVAARVDVFQRSGIEPGSALARRLFQ